MNGLIRTVAELSFQVGPYLMFQIRIRITFEISSGLGALIAKQGQYQILPDAGRILFLRSSRGHEQQRFKGLHGVHRC